MLFVVLKVSIRKDNDFPETMVIFQVKFYFSTLNPLYTLHGFFYRVFSRSKAFLP